MCSHRLVTGGIGTPYELHDIYSQAILDNGRPVKVGDHADVLDVPQPKQENQSRVGRFVVGGLSLFLGGHGGLQVPQ
jgi:hypothetical protein